MERSSLQNPGIADAINGSQNWPAGPLAYFLPFGCLAPGHSAFGHVELARQRPPFFLGPALVLYWQGLTTQTARCCTVFDAACIGCPAGLFPFSGRGMSGIPRACADWPVGGW